MAIPAVESQERIATGPVQWQAQNLLDQAGEGEPPVQLWRVLAVAGVQLEHRPMPEGIPGFAVRGIGLPRIVVNTGLTDSDGRFVAAALLGGLIMGHGGVPVSHLAVHAEKANEVARTVAQMFAREVLMPVGQILRHARVWPNAPVLARIFQVPRQVAALRLSELGITSRDLTQAEMLDSPA